MKKIFSLRSKTPVVALFAVLVSLFFSVGLTSCGGDDDEPAGSVVGYYYGSTSSGNRNYTMSLSLDSDKTGDYVYTTPSYTVYGEFTWKMSGKKIILNGAWADTTGDSGSDKITLSPKGDGYAVSRFSNMVIYKR